MVFFNAIWGFVSYGLAGNWAFNFGIRDTFVGSTIASVYFWYYTYTVIILPIVILIIYRLHAFLKKE